MGSIKLKEQICIVCKHPRYIFSHGRCKKCARSTYKPIEKSKKRIAPLSKKRAKENVEYNKLRLVFLKEYPICQAGLEGCKKKSNEIHHMAGRTGKLLLNKAFFLATCWSCHKIIEVSPATAKKLGLSMERLNK